MTMNAARVRPSDPSTTALRPNASPATQNAWTDAPASGLRDAEGPSSVARADQRSAYAEQTRGPEGIGNEVGRARAEPARDFEGGIGAPLPPSSGDATVTEEGDRIVLDAGAGDDQIDVTPRADGGVRVSVNGANHDFTAEQADRLTIRAGDGDDRVNVDLRVQADLRIEGGDGDDALVGGAGDEVMLGGRGNDYMEGGAGDDVMSGGAGRDVMYGLDGDDRMSGGGGRDYLDGGRGDDRLAGGEGVDQVMGGRGDDDLRGGAGDDVLAGGHGRDAFNGDEGADRVLREGSEWVARDRQDTRVEVDMSGGDPGSSVTVNGDARFQSRVESDLDAMRSTESGRALLTDLDATGRSTTIDETDRGNAAGYTTASDRLMTGNNTVNGAGTDTQIDYNPSRTETSGSHAWSHRPPVVGLQHELVHAENAAHGEMPTGRTDGDKNRERIAVGLPIDHDGDGGATTPRIQPNTHTENGFRQELNLERREQY